jgi:hypothetical protein
LDISEDVSFVVSIFRDGGKYTIRGPEVFNGPHGIEPIELINMILITHKETNQVILYVMEVGSGKCRKLIGERAVVQEQESVLQGRCVAG